MDAPTIQPYDVGGQLPAAGMLRRQFIVVGIVRQWPLRLEDGNREMRWFDLGSLGPDFHETRK